MSHDGMLASAYGKIFDRPVDPDYCADCIICKERESLDAMKRVGETTNWICEHCRVQCACGCEKHYYVGDTVTIEGGAWFADCAEKWAEEVYEQFLRNPNSDHAAPEPDFPADYWNVRAWLARRKREAQLPKVAA